ncbi:MAG TPA: aminotransferase class I/II-fold pyridoxal phosphate-dependent enzyme [Acidimicrobiia bacterium]
MSDPAVYSPPMYDPSVDLDLSRNEGRTRAAELIAAVADPDRAVSRYPDTSGVRARLAAIHGLDPSRILVTAGGDDALSRCFPALLGEGGRAVTTYPTFEMISRYAEQSRVDLVEVPWWSGPFPVGEIVAAAHRGDTAFIVSPNNPTGAAFTGTDLKRVAAEFRHVVLDAAYVEFADEDLTPTALGMDNVVVIRTLSKAYGLAGLRVGYLLGPPELVNRIAAYGSPYPVAALSAAVAESRLSWPVSETERFVEAIRSQRAALAETLSRLGTRPLPSQANFVLTECADADWVMTAARSLGVAFRRFADRPGMERMVRVTLPGDDADFDRLAATLESTLAPQALVFDLDGVIADVSRSQTVAIVETAKIFGVDVTPADIEQGKARGNANDDWALTRDLCAARGVEIPLDVLTDRYEGLYQGRDGSPGLKELERPLVDAGTWRRWGRDRPLAVVTGRPRSDAVEFLERFDLMSGTAALITRDEAPLKPDPAPVRLALETLGVTAAWMLGDTPDDVVAARGAGVVPIGVVAPGDDPIRARERLRLAARVLDQTTDLEEMMP